VNGTGKSWLHRDYLGSVRAITDAVGAKVEAAIYKPFGEQSEWLLPGNAAPETKGWIGERFDADAGLQYLNARYYDPELSLFLQPDWFEVTNAGVGTNRFSYSFNDPVNKFDPGGNAWWNKVAIKGVVIAAEESAQRVASRFASPSTSRLGKVADRIGKKVDDASKALDAFDASVQVAEGNWAGATMSALGAFDLGYIGNAARVEVAARRANRALDALEAANSGALRIALGSRSGDLTHHVISRDLVDHDVVQAALEGGFDFNGIENGINVVHQAGNHAKYTSRIRDDLSDFAADNPDYTAEEAADFLREVADREKDDIVRNGNRVENR
jgi:RHS repeat-associated protein